MNKVIIIGFGYVGLRVAKAELAQGRHVTALVRSHEKAHIALTEQIVPHWADLDDTSTLHNLDTAEADIYYFAPPPNDGVSDSRLRAFLTTLTPAKGPRNLLYISTTGVYGSSSAGQILTEASPTLACQPRGLRRLDAEAALHAWHIHHPTTRLTILRVAGIYGPAKLPLERIKRGEPVLEASHRALINLIHIDDLTQVCLAALRSDQNRNLYNVCDGHPVTMTDYLRAIAHAFQLPQPPSITLQEASEQLSPGFLSYLQESRHISNEKMLRQLQITLHYPSYLLGIQACLRHLT